MKLTIKTWGFQVAVLHVGRLENVDFPRVIQELALSAN